MKTLTLSYFTGEQHSKNFEQIIRLAEELGYSVRIYESKETTQFDFLQAVYRDTVTIVDATIPDDLTLSTVYPLLTVHVNLLDHILVFSDRQYEDGIEIMPLNICPQRKRYWLLNKDLLVWLREQLYDLKNHQYYERFEIESIEKLIDLKYPMERIIEDSLELHKMHLRGMKRVMISYRNSYSQEVENWRKEVEEAGDIEIKCLPPGSLLDDYEVLTPMRRWMLAGVIENHMRSVDEVWVYYTDDYDNSWWTLVDLVMVAYINYNREEKDKIRFRVYDAQMHRFMEEHEHPTFLHIQLSHSQHQRILRLLSNTRSNTYEDSNLSSLCIRFLDQHYREIASLLLNTLPGRLDYIAPRIVRDLKELAWKLIFMAPKKRKLLFEQLRPIIELSVPSNLPFAERDQMVNELLAMYSNPCAILAYTKEEAFKEVFWNNISYQSNFLTSAYRGGSIDVDAFIDTPMRELTEFNDKNLHSAVRDDKAIMLKGQRYYVREGKTRYFWLPTHNDTPSVGDAPGIKIAQTYYWTPLSYFIFDEKDSDKAQIVFKQLSNHGITSFKDDRSAIGESNDNTNYSHDYLVNCRIVIVLISSANAKSQGLMKKIEFAKNIGKHIIPIIVDYKSLPRELIRLLGGSSFLEWKADVKELDEMIMHTIFPILGESTDKHVPFFRREKADDYEIKALDNYFPQEIEYKIFISYRREGGVDLARSIKQQLQIFGYDNIFFDYNSIRDGKFNTQILDAIYSCDVFLLLLTPGSMNRCVNKGDWVAREIRTALKYNRHIIPITIENAFIWPSDLPDDMKELKNIQRHKILTDEHFEYTIKRLSQRIEVVNPRKQNFYKIKIDKRCRLKTKDKEFLVLEASKMDHNPLPKGELIRKEDAIKDDNILKEYVLVLNQEEMSLYDCLTN